MTGRHEIARTNPPREVREAMAAAERATRDLAWKVRQALVAEPPGTLTDAGRVAAWRAGRNRVVAQVLDVLDAAGVPAAESATGAVDLERAKDDWFHGRRHINCLTCNGYPWAHPGTCPEWAGPTEGAHLDPPCGACGRCEHLHHGIHRDRGGCAAFVLPASTGRLAPVVTDAMVRAAEVAYALHPGTPSGATKRASIRAALEAALATGTPAETSPSEAP